MATENRHITRIVNAWANRANLDNGQTMILTDATYNYAHAWKYNNLYFVPAVSKSYNGAAWTYYNSEFQNVTAYGDVNAAEYIYHDGDTDNYERLQDDRRTWVVGGVQMMDMLEDGSQDLVRFGGSATDVDFIVDANGRANAIFVQGSDGAIGFGTSSPAASRDFEFTVADADYPIMRLSGFVDSTSCPNLELYHARGTRASPTATQAGDLLGYIAFLGYDTAASVGAAIYAEASFEWGTAGDTSDNPTKIVVATCPDGSGTLVDRMTINSKGNVGIGTPTTVLEDWSTSYRALQIGALGALWSYATESAGYNTLLSNNLYYDTHFKRIVNDEACYLDMVNGTFSWYTVAAGAADTDIDATLTEKMRLTNAGLLGIGTSAPSSLLDLQQAGTAKQITDILEITNSGNAADMDGTGAGILFNQFYYDASTPAVADAGRIAVIAETDWTSTASTQDSAMAFSTALDGTVAEKMRITSAGYVGVNTTAPDCMLHLFGSSAGAISAAAGSLLCIEGPDPKIQMLSPNDDSEYIYFGDVDSNSVGTIYYSHSGDSLNFGANGMICVMTNAMIAIASGKHYKFGHNITAGNVSVTGTIPFIDASGNTKYLVCANAAAS